MGCTHATCPACTAPRSACLLLLLLLLVLMAFHLASLLTTLALGTITMS